ncbi:uncharacterized protein [Anolis sagrei]|uniref:uncharacterized protein n=1 Tax=Anolis sagrei TaxID=38937 RepID=UPI00352228DD
MENLYSAKHPSGRTVCCLCLQPCQHLTIQPCGHHFCHACSSQSWEEELKGKIVCSVCQDFFLKMKPGSKEPLRKGTTGSMVVDETKQVDLSLCEIHKEDLNLFCVEDQVPLCSVCRKSWDHMAHNIIPRDQEAKTENQGTGSPYRGWGDECPNSEANSPAVVGYANDTVAFQGKELLDGNQKDDPEKVKLFDLDLEEKQEEGNNSTSSGQNSITWIVLVLFIIQIAGLVTTIFVFTKAKADLPSSAAVTGIAPCCPSGWTMIEGNCYHAVELEGTWEDGQHHCSSLGASLAVFVNLEKLNEGMNDKSLYNHWIGLLREPEESWKWTDGTPFNNLFEIRGDGQCAYLTHGAVSSADCSVKKKCLCSQSVKTNHGHCRGT